MRFPRHARIFRGQLDAAPFAGVFFLVLIFITLNSPLVFTPGVRVELPEADGLPGVANPAAVVVVDRSGKYYIENQVIGENELKPRLRAAAERAKARNAPVTLMVLADKQTPNDHLFRLSELAREAGIRELLQVTRPRLAPGAVTIPPP